jgi:mannose/fructose/N-acetylgalactosamine-specific phosphotransferase system component IID
MSFAKSQKGASVLGIMVILGLVAFFLSAGLKIGPHYMDYYTMEKLIKAIETDKSGDITSVQDFYARISKGMTINSVRGFDL